MLDRAATTALPALCWTIDIPPSPLDTLKPDFVAMGTNSSALRRARSFDASDGTRSPEPLAAEVTLQTRFDIAAARAMARYSPADWVLLEPARRTGAIYAELRQLDTELSAQPARNRPRP